MSARSQRGRVVQNKRGGNSMGLFYALLAIIAIGGVTLLATTSQRPASDTAGAGRPTITTTVALDSLPSRGAAGAPVTVVEYADFQCPACGVFADTLEPGIVKDYIDTGKVRFIFREFPLDPLAAAAAMLARCAGKDKYFPLVDAFFAQQKDWVVQKPLQPMFAIAKQAGFTQQSFDECLANQQLLNNLEEQRTRATQKFKVNSTPTFFINGKTVRGALTPEELDKQIAPYLKG